MRSSTVPARVSQVRIAIAVALRQAPSPAAAVRCAGQALDFQVHQPLGGEADHLAQQVSVGGLLQEGLEVHGIAGGHRRVPLPGLWSGNQTLAGTAMTATAVACSASAYGLRSTGRGGVPTPPPGHNHASPKKSENRIARSYLHVNQLTA